MSFSKLVSWLVSNSRIAYEMQGGVRLIAIRYLRTAGLPLSGSGKLPKTLANAGKINAFGAAQDSEDFVFFHDQQLFAVNLDFRSGILAKKNAVAFFDCQGNGLAFFILTGTSS